MRHRILLALATAVSLAVMVTLKLLERLRRGEASVRVAGARPVIEPQPVAPARAPVEAPDEPAPTVWLPEGAPALEATKRAATEPDDVAGRWMPEDLLAPTAAATRLPVNRARRLSAPTRRQTVAGTTAALAVAAAVAVPLVSGDGGPGARIVGIAQVPHARGPALIAQRAAYAGPAGTVVHGPPGAAAGHGLGVNAPAAGHGQTSSGRQGAAGVSRPNAGSGSGLAPAGHSSAPQAPSAPSAPTHSSPPATTPSQGAPATAASGAPASSSSTVNAPSAPAPGSGSGSGSPTPVQSAVSTVQSTVSSAPSTVSSTVSTVTSAVPPPPSAPSVP